MNEQAPVLTQDKTDNVAKKAEELFTAHEELSVEREPYAFVMDGVV